MFLTLPFRRRRSAPLVPAGERVYAIGDIHGRMDLFHRLLELLHDDEKSRGPATTHIVVVGDFIDRGPQSAKVVSTLEWWQRNSSRVTILKGNHEAALLESRAGDPHAQRLWLSYGGLDTLRSFGVEPRKGCSSNELAALIRSSISEATIAWLEQLPISHRIGDYFFSHAGVKPGVPLEQQKPEHLLWGAEEFLGSRRDHGAAIVHGHTVCGSRVQFAPNRICIDTGAYCTGILSAVGLEDHRQWSISTPPEPVWPSVGSIGGHAKGSSSPQGLIGTPPFSTRAEISSFHPE